MNKKFKVSVFIAFVFSLVIGASVIHTSANTNTNSTTNIKSHWEQHHWYMAKNQLASFSKLSKHSKKYNKKAPKASSSYWNKTRTVKINRNVTVQNWKAAQFADQDSKIGTKVIKKGTKLKVQNGGASFAWVVKGNGLTTTSDSFWVVSRTSSKWMNVAGKSSKKVNKKHSVKRNKKSTKVPSLNNIKYWKKSHVLTLRKTVKAYQISNAFFNYKKRTTGVTKTLKKGSKIRVYDGGSVYLFSVTGQGISNWEVNKSNTSWLKK